MIKTLKCQKDFKVKKNHRLIIEIFQQIILYIQKIKYLIF